MALTDKQARFVDEYIIDLDPSAAYRRAGYKVKSDESARAAAARLLANVNVSAAVSERQKARSERTEITQDWVLARLKVESLREGEGSSHSARISALKAVGDHLGMFKERQPLDVLLDALPAELARGLREALTRLLAEQESGALPGQAQPDGALPQ